MSQLLGYYETLRMKKDIHVDVKNNILDENDRTRFSNLNWDIALVITILPLQLHEYYLQ